MNPVVNLARALEIIILPQPGNGLGNPPGQGGDVFLQLAGGSEHAADADLNRIQPPLRLRKIAQKSLQFRRNVRFILRGAESCSKREISLSRLFSVFSVPSSGSSTSERLSFSRANRCWTTDSSSGNPCSRGKAS